MVKSEHHVKRTVGVVVVRKVTQPGPVVEQDLALGQLIYDLRTEAGLSQGELAEGMGTTQSVISRLEEGSGARNRIGTLASVATALNRHLIVSFPRRSRPSSRTRSRSRDLVTRMDMMDPAESPLPMSPAPLLVTVDTNLLDEHRIVELRAPAEGALVEFATVTVNERERGAVDVDVRVVPETAVWGESRWGEAVWGGPIPELMVLDETPLGSGVLASDAGVDVFERVLSIVSSGSFPRSGAREKLTEPQRRQLRDAMAFEAHVRQRLHVYLSDDKKAFISHSRREALKALGRTCIFTSAEFIALGPGYIGHLLRSN